MVSDVCPGEGLRALILTINLVTLLGAYYLLKTVRESLQLAEGGAEVKAFRISREAKGSIFGRELCAHQTAARCTATVARGRTRKAAVHALSGAFGASSSVQQWNTSRQSEADRPVGFSIATPQSRPILLRPRSRSAASRVQRPSDFICHFRRRRRKARRLDDIPQRTGTMGPLSGRVYRPEDLAGGIGGTAHWQRRNRAL